MSGKQQRISVVTPDGRKHDLVVIESQPNSWKTRQVVRGKYLEAIGDSAEAAAESWVLKYQQAFPN
jgi:hypothetical protein